MAPANGGPIVNLDAAERAVCATLLAAFPVELPPNLARVLRHAPESFSHQQAGAIVEAIRELADRGVPVAKKTVLDHLTAKDRLDDAGGALAIEARSGDVVRLDLAEYEAAAVWSAYYARRTQAVLTDASGVLADGADPATVTRGVIEAFGFLSKDSPRPDALPPIVDAAAFLSTDYERPRELVAGILHQGSKMVFGGGSKTFKTWTLLDLAISVSAGAPWFSFETTKGRALYVNFEIQDRFFQDRVKGVARAKGIELQPGLIDLWNLRGRASGYALLLPKIIEAVREAKYSLIVLDPIYKLYGSTDENSAGEVAKLLNAIESLAVTTGAAVAFGAHYSKGNQAGKESIDRISGSGVFARDPDSILNLTRHEVLDAFTVEMTLRNFKPIEPFVVRWQFPLMLRDAELDPSKLKKVGGRPRSFDDEDILALLPPGGLTATQWVGKAMKIRGISRSSFYLVQKRLEKSERIILSKINGKWQPVQKVQ